MTCSLWFATALCSVINSPRVVNHGHVLAVGPRRYHGLRDGLRGCAGAAVGVRDDAREADQLESRVRAARVAPERQRRQENRWEVESRQERGQEGEGER